MMSAAPPARRVPAREAPGGRDRSRVLLPALAAAGSAVLAAAVAVAFGGATPLLLARVGARLALDLSWAAVLGILAVLLLTRGEDDRRRGSLLDLAAVAAGIAAVAAATTAFLLYLGQAPAMSSPAFGPGLVAFVSEIAVGRTWLVAAILAAVLSAALVAVRSSSGLLVLALLAAACLVPVALQSATPDGTLASTRTTGAASFVLLLAAGTWTGAAVVHATTGSRRDAGLPRALGASCALLAVAAVLLGAVPLLPFGLPLAVVLLVALLAALLRVGRLPGSVLLGLAAGLAVAARVLQSAPTSAAARTSPAEILTGAPLPQAPSIGRLLGAWQPDAVWLLAGVGLLVAYAAAVLRVRRGGGRWSALRTGSWVVGVLLLVWCTSGGPAAYATVLLSAHLGQHAALATAVPLLLAGGAPLRLLRSVSPDALVPADAVPLRRRPVPAVVLAAAAFLALYATPLLRWSATDAVGAEWAVLQCLLTGALLVAALLAAPRRTAAVAAEVLLLVEAAAAAVLAAGPGLLLADWYGAMGWGTDALVDQRTGAMLAWAVTAASTLVLLVAALRRPRAVPRPAAARPASSQRSEVPA
jgi:putative copper resistance protein D